MKALAILLLAGVLATNGEYINTPNGKVKCSSEMIDDKPYQRCSNIKYAEVEERFQVCSFSGVSNVCINFISSLQPAKPVQPRKISKDPINEDSSPICVQDPSDTLSDFRTSNISEDCLYLHVFVPEGHQITTQLPVVFYIHGGGGSFGNGPKVPSKMLKKDVIMVTFNYRLDIFGKVPKYPIGQF